MINLTHQGAVPQISIDGEMVIGFNEKLLREKLGLAAPAITTTVPPTSPPTTPTRLPTPTPTTRVPTITPTVLVPTTPVLISPAEGAVLDNGRFDGRDRIIWDFNWDDVPGATQYQLYVINANAASPVINAQTGYSSYHWENSGSIGGGSADQYRYGWIWRVRALVNGLWSGWSQRTFNVEPVDSDPATPITVPPPTPTTPPPTLTPTITPLTLKFVTSLAPTSSEYLAVYKPMLDEIEQRSGGRIRFNVYPQGTLVSAADQYNAIAAGVADMGVSYFGYIADRFPLSDAFTFPAAYSLTNAGEDLVHALGNRIFALVPSETVVLSYFQQQSQFLYTAHKQVRTLEDIKGLKLRASGSLQASALSTLGASPISLTSAEICIAIQAGVIEGALVTPSMADSLRLTEVTKYALRLPFGYAVGMININASTWSRFRLTLSPLLKMLPEKPVIILCSSSM